MQKALALATIAAFAGLGGAAQAADTSYENSRESLKDAPTPFALPIEWEAGLRYWFSTGKYKKDLFDTSGKTQLSRLTYDDLTGHAAEGFFRADILRNFFVKGALGGGSITGGKFNDEDFPPGIQAYSNTLSSQRDGNIEYFNADIGYSFYGGGQDGLKDAPRGWTWRAGGLVGYGQWSERLNTFGCNQLQPVNESCNLLGSQFNGLDNDVTWNMLRVGATGDLIAGRWKLTGEVAYVHGSADATDWHNMRPDIRGIREDATGDGVQAEAILSYAVTPSFSVGVGGRYWSISGDGKSHFEDKLPGAQAEPIKLESERYGLLVQGALKLGEDDPLSLKDSAAVIRSWTGAYIGVNIGYGSGSSQDDINGASPSGVFFAANGFIDRGAFSNVDNKGVLGGGQVGYNYQLGRSLVGVEADFDGASIAGSTGIVSSAGLLTSTEREIDFLSTIRARVGYLASPQTLLYVTGGVAFGDTKVALNVRDIVSNVACAQFVCSTGSNSDLSVGYAVGGGFEYKLNEGISLKGEYLYVDLGSRSVTTVDSGAGGYNANFKDRVALDANVFRVGLNYQVGSQPETLK